MKLLTPYQRRKMRDKMEELYYQIDCLENEAEEIQRELDKDLKVKKKRKNHKP